MEVRDLGEFGLIERLRQKLAAASEQLILGPGDDAAVWRSSNGYTIATTDTLVAGVHFLPTKVAWSDVGWKALAVNISDIAAMGGTPKFALVTLHLPPESTVEDVDELYAGIRECAEEYSVEIAGGDIVSSPVFAITVALMGDATVAADGSPMLLRRDAARIGDAVAVTGTMGGSAGGLRALMDDVSRAPEVTAMIDRHMRPRPRVEAGQAALRAGIRCAIDVSDGLVQDLEHVCTASGVGATIRLRDVPVDRDLTRTYPDDAHAMALGGGEDYELILVGGEEGMRVAAKTLGDAVHVIGRIEDSVGVRVIDGSGNEMALSSAGWDHFTKNAPL